MYPGTPLHENQGLSMTLIELQRNRTVDVIWIRRLQRASPVPPPPRARSPLAAPKITRGLFPSRAPSANSGCARVPPTEPAPRRRPQGCARRPPAEPARDAPHADPLAVLKVNQLLIGEQSEMVIPPVGHRYSSSKSPIERGRTSSPWEQAARCNFCRNMSRAHG